MLAILILIFAQSSFSIFVPPNARPFCGLVPFLWLSFALNQMIQNTGADSKFNNSDLEKMLAKSIGEQLLHQWYTREALENPRAQSGLVLSRNNTFYAQK